MGLPRTPQPEDNVAQTVRGVAAKIRDAQQQHRSVLVGTVRRTAGTLERHFAAWADDVRARLVEQLGLREKIGTPPSFVRVAGQNDLEKPFNRLLGWWADPAADHGLGRAFARELARELGLTEMVVDIDGELPLKVHCEDRLEEESAKEPDLVVLTPHAAIMLENKVYAPESGDQYGPYLGVFRKLAGDRANVAVLCSRDQREPPPDWSKRVLLHTEIGRLFRTLADLPNASAWGRVSALVTAAAFEDESVEPLVEARTLLSCPPTTLRRPRSLRRSGELLQQLERMQPPVNPWRSP